MLTLLGCKNDQAIHEYPKMLIVWRLGKSDFERRGGVPRQLTSAPLPYDPQCMAERSNSLPLTPTCASIRMPERHTRLPERHTRLPERHTRLPELYCQGSAGCEFWHSDFAYRIYFFLAQSGHFQSPSGTTSSGGERQ